MITASSFGMRLMERMMGVEPTLPAWEAEVLPMNYIRVYEDYSTRRQRFQQKLLPPGSKRLLRAGELFLYGAGVASGSAVGSVRLMNMRFRSAFPSIPGTSPSWLYCQILPA